MYLTSFSTPWGEAGVSWTESGVNGLFLNINTFSREYCTIAKTEPFDAVGQLGYYFKGKLKAFSVPLDLQGTPFQKNVWQGLIQIPYGNTWSYRQVAQTVGCPRSFRAVGGAIGANPVPIIIPCHRVIRADGTLGGFSLGLELKKQLLALEHGTELEPPGSKSDNGVETAPGKSP